MRRFASAATTTAHLLYEEFMSKLSRAIFKVDPGDYDLLRQAKRQQAESAGHVGMSEAGVTALITKREIQLHCRRAVRSPDELEQTISQLVRHYSSKGTV